MESLIDVILWLCGDGQLLTTLPFQARANSCGSDVVILRHMTWKSGYYTLLGLLWMQRHCAEITELASQESIARDRVISCVLQDPRSLQWTHSRPSRTSRGYSSGKPGVAESYREHLDSLLLRRLRSLWHYQSVARSFPVQ